MNYFYLKININVHKENNIKIVTIEEYKKIHSLLTVLNSIWQTKIWSMTQLVHLITFVLLQI
jgi:hypothetical protein